MPCMRSCHNDCHNKGVSGSLKRMAHLSSQRPVLTVHHNCRLMKRFEVGHEERGTRRTAGSTYDRTSREKLQPTIYACGTVRIASVHKALAGGVGGREVGADQRLQHLVAAEGLHADVMGVWHHITQCWEICPPVVPASEAKSDSAWRRHPGWGISGAY